MSKSKPNNIPRHKRDFVVITQVYDSNTMDTRWRQEKASFGAMKKHRGPVFIWRMEDLQGTQHWTADDEAWLKSQLKHYKELPPEKRRRLKMRVYHHAFGGISKESESRRKAYRSMGIIALWISILACLAWLGCVVYNIFVTESTSLIILTGATAAICLIIGFLLLHYNQQTLSWYQKVCTKQLRYDVLWGEISSDL